MMTEEMMRIIRMEVRKQINVLLPALSQNAAQQTEDIVNMYSGIGNALPQSPIVRPYGLISLSPNNTPQIVGRVGDSEGNRVVLGHRDQNAPLPQNPGETTLYSSGGFAVRVKNGSLEIGKSGIFEPVVMGNSLNTFLISLVNLINLHTHGYDDNGNPATTLVPGNATAFTTLQTSTLSNNSLLCETGGHF